MQHVFLTTGMKIKDKLQFLLRSYLISTFIFLIFAANVSKSIAYSLYQPIFDNSYARYGMKLSIFNYICLMKFILPLFLLSFMLIACLPNEPTFDAFRRVELSRLLSNQDTKKWLLDERIIFGENIGFENCEVPRQLIFKLRTSNNGRDSLFYVNPSDTCGISSDTLKGYWFIPTTLLAEVPTDTVYFVWENTDTAYFTVMEINPDFLQIKTTFETDSLEERFYVFNEPEVVDSIQ